MEFERLLNNSNIIKVKPKKKYVSYNRIGKEYTGNYIDFYKDQAGHDLNSLL